MKTPFRKLKTALLILSSNFSTVMDEIRKTNKPHTFSKLFSNSRNGEDFNIKIDNDYLPTVELSKEGSFFWIKYDQMRYCFTPYTIAVQISGKSFSVDIKEVESKTDMFSLSTTNDFYDLSYTDIVAIREFIHSCNSILSNKKHV